MNNGLDLPTTLVVYLAATVIVSLISAVTLKIAVRWILKRKAPYWHSVVTWLIIYGAQQLMGLGVGFVAGFAGWWTKDTEPAINALLWLASLAMAIFILSVRLHCSSGLAGLVCLVHLAVLIGSIMGLAMIIVGIAAITKGGL